MYELFGKYVPFLFLARMYSYCRYGSIRQIRVGVANDTKGTAYVGISHLILL